MYGVALQKTQQFRKSICASVGYGGGQYRGRTDQTFTIEAGEEVIWTGEEGGEAEREEVWSISWFVEDVAWDLKLAVADGDEDTLLV